MIREAGARAIARYGTVEAGGIAEGCLAPVEADDLHLFHDLYALIQAGGEGVHAALPRDALLISCVRPTSPLLLLNVSLGDQAVVEARACGCPLEQLGWATHLHTIRSHEKLTAGGMTFLDVDVVRVLEENLPARFGGGPTDYQLVETEADDGRPRLKLLVHPAIGPLDEREVADAFLRGIAATSDAGRMMGRLWQESGWLEVERSVPRVTGAGKILHLHQERGPRSQGAAAASPSALDPPVSGSPR